MPDAIEVFGDVDMVAVGQRFRRARLDADLTKTGVAVQADINPGHYGELENGKLHGLTLNTFYKLCMVLRADANAMLGIPPVSQAPSPWCATGVSVRTGEG